MWCKTKSEVAKAKQEAYDESEERFSTEEGEKDLYQLVIQIKRHQGRKDVQPSKDKNVVTHVSCRYLRWLKKIWSVTLTSHVMEWLILRLLSPQIQFASEEREVDPALISWIHVYLMGRHHSVGLGVGGLLLGLPKGEGTAQILNISLNQDTSRNIQKIVAGVRNDQEGERRDLTGALRCS